MKSEYDDPDNWDAYRYEHLAYTKWNAKKRKLKFNLTVEDFVYPDVCPLLGIPISRKLVRDNAPSIDRVDNTKGYIKGNVCIISNKANVMKRDHTLETLQLFLDYIKSKTQPV